MKDDAYFSLFDGDSANVAALDSAISIKNCPVSRCLTLEVIINHDYDKSSPGCAHRDVVINEVKGDVGAKEAVKEAPPVHFLHLKWTAVHQLDKLISQLEITE